MPSSRSLLVALIGWPTLAACSHTSAPEAECATHAECDGGLCFGGRCMSALVLDAGVMDGASGDSPACVDLDHDGHGEGCLLGLDCDDADPSQTGAERCDGADNDCDGLVDEGVRTSCGDCDPTCEERGLGAGGRPAWDLEHDPSEGVGVAVEDGALILDSRNFDTHVIWLADTALDTVTKVDTRTFAVLARYRTGPEDQGHDPSRTSVASRGDVYVGNRAGRSVTRISALGEACADRNGDGIVFTSRSATDVKAWPAGAPLGDDECIVWRTFLGEDSAPVRAVAAQDILGPDDELVESVWVGDDSGQHVWKIDGPTGEILFRTEAPANPYGFALDGFGNLWIAESSALGRIDTNRCVDEASCSGAVCLDEGGDGCVKQRIAAPASVYGITVDYAQRVWTGGEIHRYTHDPALPMGERWLGAGTSARPTPNTYGIAADRRGWVWAAEVGGRAIRVDQEDPREWTRVSATGPQAKGMAVDVDGKVWCISEEADGRASVIEPGDELRFYSVTPDVAPLEESRRYTYSDMTGEQLRIATNPRGSYAHVFEGCPDLAGAPRTRWASLAWDADLPPYTSLRFRARVAPTRAELASRPWSVIAEAPPATSPLDLRAIFEAMSIGGGRLLELEIQLRTERTREATLPITPRVRSVDLRHHCEAVVD